MEENDLFKREVGNYLDSEKYDGHILRKGILKNLINEKELYKKDIESSNVSNIISFISTAEIEDFDFYAVEKTLQVFERTNKIILLATEETKYNANTLKANLEKANRSVEVVNTGLDDYEEIYETLVEIMEGFELDRNETIIDSTQGPRMLGAVFYKFAVEQGIKLVSWQGRINSANKRIPGSDKFNFIKAPQLKNYKLYQNVNKLINNYKFKEASMLYAQINNNDMAFVLDKLGNIFSYTALENYDTWIEEIKLNIDFFKGVKDKSIKKKIEKYEWLFSQFLKTYDEGALTEDNIEDRFLKIDWSNLTDYILKNNTFGLNSYCWIDKNHKEVIHGIIFIEYLKGAYPEFYEAILYDSVNKVAEYLSEENYLDKELDIVEIAKQFNINEGMLQSIFYEEKKLFNITKDFLYKIPDFLISFEDGIISIPQKKLEIDLGNKYKDSTKKNNRILHGLFKNKELTISGKDFIVTLLGENYNEVTNPPKYIKDFEKFYKEINHKIFEEHGLEDFFLFEEFPAVNLKSFEKRIFSLNDKYKV